MYINTLLILCILLSHIYSIKFKKHKFRYDELKIRFDELEIKSNELKFKYDSKQWVSPLVHGMIAGFSTRHFK